MFCRRGEAENEWEDRLCLPRGFVSTVAIRKAPLLSQIFSLSPYQVEWGMKSAVNS